MFNKDNSGNIILYQITSNDPLSIKEVNPLLQDSSINKFLILNNNKELLWSPFELREGNNIFIHNNNGFLKIDASVDTRIIINDKLIGTNVYYKDERIGIGRAPLYEYKFDIEVPKNTLLTAFHIGDGSHGFSMGNGTSQGFIPEIIGMGDDENDAGLYFVGRSGNDVSSDIPLIIIDGRNANNNKLSNRPIFGITSAEYNNYKFIVDKNGLVGIGKIPEKHILEVNGIVKAKDFVLDSSISISQLIELIVEQNTQIDIIKNQVTELQKLIK